MGSLVFIGDKDGGIITELRAQRGDIPVYLAPTGDGRNYWEETIDITASGDNTLHTPVSGKKFYVTSLVFSVGASGEVQFKSGTTNLSGPMNFAAYGGLAHTNPSDPSGYVFSGRAINNALILTVSNPTLDIGGYVKGYDE